ncbi:MAG: ChaB family protein [Bauldia sp.]|nr:ChaB family protein [Bauldia sp.]
MPYATNADLPPSVRGHLPEHAQEIYREAFNHAFAAHAGDPRQEEAAHRIAWAAVKRSYVKVGRDWVARDLAG